METCDPASLLNQISELSKRIAELESVSTARKTRQRRLSKISLIVAAGVGVLSAGAAVAITSSGVALFQFMDFSTTGATTVPALDTSVRWDRFDPAGKPVGYTNQILSLVSEATQKNSYSWPLYVQLNATNSAAATMNSSQSVGATVRAFQRSTGTPWLVGFHSEIFHGLDGITGTTVATNGTSILFNGELTTSTGGGTTVGLNIVNTNNSTDPGTDAINIQPGSQGWSNGIHFDTGATGNIGINFDAAQYNMGLDMANNSIRINANQKLVLEGTGQVFLRYNSATGKVEIVKSGVVVASW